MKSQVTIAQAVVIASSLAFAAYLVHGQFAPPGQVAVLVATLVSGVYLAVTPAGGAQ